MSSNRLGAPRRARQFIAPVRRREKWIGRVGLLASLAIHVSAAMLWPTAHASYRQPGKVVDPLMTLIMPMMPLPEPLFDPPAAAAPRKEEPKPPSVPDVFARPPEIPLLGTEVLDIPKIDMPLLGEPAPLPPPVYAPPAPVAAATPAAAANPKVDEWSTYEPITAATVQPDIRNRAEVRRYLERLYQPVVSRTGATGSTLLRFWIDEKGVAQRIVMVESSGNDRLDEVALSVAEVIRFRPAVQSGVPVRVVVDVPIKFQATMRM